jgi:hypothetical protein
MRVDVYYNLRKRCLSVRKGGIVVQHTPSAVLEDVTFVVSEAGRQRVLRERRKNVHAFVRGTLVDTGHTRPERSMTRIYYNPYEAGCFRTEDGTAVVGAGRVRIWGSSVYADGVVMAGGCS